MNQQYEAPTDFESQVRVRRKTLVSTFMSDDDLIRVLEQGEMGSYVARAVKTHNANALSGEAPITRYHVYQITYRSSIN